MIPSMTLATPLRNGRQPQYHGRRVTLEEYLDLPDDGFRYDMIDGVLYVATSHTPKHGRAEPRFAHIVLNYLDEHPVADVFLETDVLLPDGNDIVRPDVCVIRNERLHMAGERIIRGAPDLVAELLSDSTAQRDLGVKSERYLASGVHEYWLPDPRDQSLRVRHRVEKRGFPKWEEVRGASLESRLFPGLVIEAGRLF